MSSNAKNVLYGAKQEAVLTPNVGYEVESVEVFNKTTNEVVPSQLEKTSDNPPQWTLSFQQPAGLVSIRPKIRPILYSVIIEQCTNCNIVLLEYDDSVDIRVAPAAERSEAQQMDNGENPERDTGSEDNVNFNQPQHSANDEESSDSKLNVGENVTLEAGSPAQEEETLEEMTKDLASSNKDVSVPAESDDGIKNVGAGVESAVEENADTDDEARTEDEADVADETNAVKEVSSEVEADTEVVAGTEEEANVEEEVDANDEVGAEDESGTWDEAGTQDSVYDAGEFQSELEEFVPEVITGKARDKKNELYWQYRRAFDAGQITEEKFKEVRKKHMQFLDDISKGKIVVKE